MNNTKIIFYFDFLSPYVHMALNSIGEFTSKNKVDLELVPVLFAGLLNAGGQKGPAEIPAKREYVWKEMLRWGVMHNKTIKGPPAHPFNPLPSLRICAAVEDAALKIKLTLAITKACWEEGRDISDATILNEIAETIGLDGTQLLLDIQNPVIKDRIKLNTDAAIAHGVFGVPTFRIDNEIFWGNDRLEQMALYLQGKLNINESLFREMMSRPRAIDRKSHKG